MNALNGAPGLYSARYAGTHGDHAANKARLLRELAGIADGSAVLISCACLCCFVMPMIRRHW